MPAAADRSGGASQARLEPVVIDASVVVAIVTTPSDAASALARRLRSTVLYAPHILPTEVDSALRGMVLGGVLTAAQGEASRRQAQGLPIDLWPWALLGDRAWALRANMSTYDAGYVALAEHLGAPLVTGDARLARAPGLSCVVELFS